MRLFFLIWILSITFISQPVFAKWGKGQLKLDKYTMESVLKYMYGGGNKNYSGDAKKKNDPLMMAVSIDGRHSMSFYCPGQYNNRCNETGIAHEAILSCEKYSRGSPCFVFAKKRRIVWKNGGSKLTIKRKDLKSPYIVAKKIQDIGFYDGDISKLSGIDLNTGQMDETITISGEKTDTSTDTSVKNSTDVVQELKTLAALYKSGALTKTEFEKAKKKLLQN